MTNVPASQDTPPSAALEEIQQRQADISSRMLIEQRAQSDLLRGMSQKLSDISGRMLVLVWGLVLLPWVCGGLYALWALIVGPRLGYR